MFLSLTRTQHHEGASLHRAAVLARHHAPTRVDFNQVYVYNKGMEQINCAACGRPANPAHTDPTMCHECAERTTAEAALETGAADMTTTDIAAITDYIEQMKTAAIAKGGTFADIEPPTTTEQQPTSEPPTMPTKPKKAPPPTITSPKGVTPGQYKGTPVHRKQPKPKSEVMPGRPMGERGQGRKPIAPELRLQPITVRLSIERREKMIALGKEWLEKAIDRAKLAEA